MARPAPLAHIAHTVLMRPLNASERAAIAAFMASGGYTGMIFVPTKTGTEMRVIERVLREVEGETQQEQ